MNSNQNCTGGSRIFTGGANPWGVPGYDIVKISRKPHEIEKKKLSKNLGERMHAGGDPRSTTENCTPNYARRLWGEGVACLRGSWGNEKNLFHDYTSRQPSAVALNIHVNMPGWGIQFLSTIFGHVSVPFRPIITIVGSWQCVHLKDQVLSFKTNGHLWKSVKNWLQKLAKSNAISKHVAFSLANISEMPI